MRVGVKRGQTVAKVAARRGHPEDARVIADKNGIRSINSKFGRDRRLLVPQDLKEDLSFDVLAGEGAPTVTDGYQKLTTVDRPMATGISVFEGYNPITLEIPIWFEAVRRNGVDVERDIKLLEKMAGRGAGTVHGDGPAPIVRVSTTDNAGKVVPLIPSNYQWTAKNSTAPVYRVGGIDWDSSPIRNSAGNRIRQLATVTLVEHTKLDLLSRSAAKRSRQKPKKRGGTMAAWTPSGVTQVGPWRPA